MDIYIRITSVNDKAEAQSKFDQIKQKLSGIPEAEIVFANFSTKEELNTVS